MGKNISKEQFTRLIDTLIEIADDYTPSEDLEKAAWEYASKECEKDAFKAGSRWQKEQDIKLIQRTKDNFNV